MRDHQMTVESGENVPIYFAIKEYTGDSLDYAVAFHKLLIFWYVQSWRGAFELRPHTKQSQNKKTQFASHSSGQHLHTHTHKYIHISTENQWNVSRIIAFIFFISILFYNRLIKKMQLNISNRKRRERKRNREKKSLH